MNVQPRAFCPSGCTDAEGKRIVTQTFDMPAKDGTEMYERAKNAPRCLECSTSRTRQKTEPAIIACPHDWEGTDKKGWLQCWLCRYWMRDTKANRRASRIRRKAIEDGTWRKNGWQTAGRKPSRRVV